MFAPTPSLLARLHAAFARRLGHPAGTPRVKKRNLELERLAKAPGPVALHDRNPLALLTSGALHR